jgi:hypothetical protein
MHFRIVHRTCGARQVVDAQAIDPGHARQQPHTWPHAARRSTLGPARWSQDKSNPMELHSQCVASRSVVPVAQDRSSSAPPQGQVVRIGIGAEPNVPTQRAFIKRARPAEGCPTRPRTGSQKGASAGKRPPFRAAPAHAPTPARRPHASPVASPPLIIRTSAMRPAASPPRICCNDRTSARAAPWPTRHERRSVNHATPDRRA